MNQEVETGAAGALSLDGEYAAELTELAQRRRQAAAMGGEQALAAFKARGRMNARERNAPLLDPGSFREMGRITRNGQYQAHGHIQRLDRKSVV